jgi:hypothetical protein
MPIEDWISDPIASKRHELTVQASPERALRLALEIPVDADPVIRMLIRMRGLRRGGTGGSGGSMEAFFRANGFVQLQRGPREIVVGIGAPARISSDRRIASAEDWRDWDRPGWFKAAATFRAEPAEGGSRLITETQAEATDAWARRWFRVYWLAIGPFSGLIRRRWLRQIAKAAEAERKIPE